MSKHISAGDTLTVGDLTDDHLGAVIEVGPMEGITHRFRLDRVKNGDSRLVTMLTAERGVKCAYWDEAVTVIAPPPVVQPDEPTELGQCIRIEGLPEYEALVVDPSAGFPFLYRLCGSVWHTRSWDEILEDAGDRRIIVSDPPRWPDETPVVPERIEVGEWPDDDTHLRAWKWIDVEGDPWWWDAQVGLWRLEYELSDRGRPLCGPWTRGERVE